MNLAPVRQAELHSDLKLQEKDELQWKKFKVEGLDENGEREAQLRRNFNGESEAKGETFLEIRLCFQVGGANVSLSAALLCSLLVGGNEC